MVLNRKPKTKTGHLKPISHHREKNQQPSKYETAGAKEVLALRFSNLIHLHMLPPINHQTKTKNRLETSTTNKRSSIRDLLSILYGKTSIWYSLTNAARFWNWVLDDEPLVLNEKRTYWARIRSSAFDICWCCVRVFGKSPHHQVLVFERIGVLQLLGSSCETTREQREEYNGKNIKAFSCVCVCDVCVATGMFGWLKILMHRVVDSVVNQMMWCGYITWWWWWGEWGQAYNRI